MYLVVKNGTIYNYVKNSKGEIDMEYKGNVKVNVTVNGNSSTHHFENEHVDFSRAGRLGIRNKSEHDSEMIGTLTEWHKMDQKEGVTSYLKIEPEGHSTVQKDMTYFILSINEEEKSVLLNWTENNR